MAKTIRIPRSGRADRRGRLAVAVGAFLVALTGPAVADECGDYRAAVVLHRAAKLALDDAVANLSTDEIDNGEAEGKLRPYRAANDHAFRALSDTRFALLRTVDEGAAATAIDAIVEAKSTIATAYKRVSAWHERATGVVPLTRSSAASFELRDAFESAERALDFALNVVCQEGAP